MSGLEVRRDALLVNLGQVGCEELHPLALSAMVGMSSQQTEVVMRCVPGVVRVEAGGEHVVSVSADEFSKQGLNRLQSSTRTHMEARCA